MNPSLTENLNQWGGQFLSFAWPMLWQSSLLIAFIFLLDLLLARRIRASVRYVLWLVVLVKLLLPPTLALPTGAAWWLFQTKSAPTPVIRNFTVTYDNTSPPIDFIPQAAVMPVPLPPKLDTSGWALLASCVVSVGLLLWLTVRWWQIAQIIRQATASEAFAATLEEARRRAGLRSRVRLKLVEGRMSPAVCGLFRPVILLPRTLAEKLSAAQLRAVLLHEIIHLRRRDVWVNCAQALLQIFYWWHPLLWVANARIRRVREEAVDDAVMLALREEADSYAPTLLEVAKLAFQRPLMSLGLVGIMESRSALRQRIERLVDFRAPRKAGLTFASLCGIFIFSAVALPMGEKPVKVPQEINPASSISTAPVAVSPVTNAIPVLIHAQIYQMRAEDFKKLSANLEFKTGAMGEDAWWSATPEKFSKLQAYLEQADFSVLTRPRIQTFSGGAAQMYVGNGTNGIEFDCTPVVKDGVVVLAVNGEVTDGDQKMVSTNQFRASTTVENLGGVVIRVESMKGLGVSNLVVVVGVQITNGVPPHFHQRLQATVRRPDGTNFVASGSGGEHGVLADPNFRTVIHALEEHSGSEYLAEPEVVTTSGRGINRITMTNISVPISKVDANQLVQDGKLLYEMGKLDEAKKKLKAALALDPENARAKNYLDLVQTSLVYTNGHAAGLTYTGLGRQGIARKLDTIRLDQVAFKAVSLGEVLRTLAAESRKRDVDQRGINFLINSYPDQVVDGFVRKIDPITGLPVTTNAAPVEDLGALLISLNQTLTNASLADVLDAVILASPKPIKYSIQDFAIVVSPKVLIPAQLFSRVYAVDPRTFAANLKEAGAYKNVDTNTPDHVGIAVGKFFEGIGVDLKSPPGKSVFYKDTTGRLFVKATASDLDTIERAIQTLSATPPQVHIKARFVEVPETFFSGAGKNSLPAGVMNGTNILTTAEAKGFYKQLESQKGFESLADPEVTTTSSRQTQMRATQIQTIITNFVFEENLTNQWILPKTGTIETGPILDVVPKVLADGYTFDLRTIASLATFYGYATPPTNLPPHTATNSTGETIDLPIILPVFREKREVARKFLFDGQTLVLFPKAEAPVTFNPDKEMNKLSLGQIQESEKQHGKKALVVFVTMDIVDRAGNRVHSDDEMSFAKDKIPPQPNTK